MHKLVKRTITIIVASAISVGAVFGIGMAVKKTTGGGPVVVIAAENLNYYWGIDNGGQSVEGHLATSAMQNVYVAATEAVAKVHVEEGDPVKEGDLLVSYDEEQAEIVRQQLELEVTRAKLNLLVGQKNLERLQHVTPVYSGGTNETPVEDPIQAVDVTEPETVPVEPYTILTLNSEEPVSPFNPWEVNDGTMGQEAHPYRYFVSGSTPIIVEGQFLQRLIDNARLNNKTSYFIQLEAHENDDFYGEIANNGAAVFLLDVMTLPAVSGNYYIDMSAAEPALYPYVPETEPTPTPVPEPTTTPEPTAFPTPEPTQTPEEVTPEPTETPVPEQSESSSSVVPEQSEESSLISEYTDLNVTASALADESDVSADMASAASSMESHLYSPVHILSLHRLLSESTTPAGGSDNDDVGAVLIPWNTQYTPEELKEARISAEENVRDLEYSLKTAELKYRLKEIELREGAIYAKLDGVARNVMSPADASIDAPIMQIVSSEGLYVDANVSEELLGKIKNGDPVSIQSWQTGMSYEGEIKDISPYPSSFVFSGTYGQDITASSYPVLIRVLDDGVMIDPYEFLQVSFSGEPVDMLNAGVPDELYLYKAFILDESGKKYVYKRGEDGLLHKTEVKVGQLAGDGWEILSGVSKSDFVAFPYGKNVVEGAPTMEGSLDDLM